MFLAEISPVSPRTMMHVMQLVYQVRSRCILQCILLTASKPPTWQDFAVAFSTCQLLPVSVVCSGKISLLYGSIHACDKRHNGKVFVTTFTWPNLTLYDFHALL